MSKITKKEYFEYRWFWMQQGYSMTLANQVCDLWLKRNGTSHTQLFSK